MTGRARTAGRAGADDPSRTRPVHSGRGTLSSVVPGLVVLGLVGVWRVWSGSWWSLVWVVAAAVVLVVLGVWFPSVLASVVARVGAVASGVVAWVVFSLVWVLVVVVPWSVGRVSRVDPVWSPGRWVSRGSVSGRAGDLWVREGSVLPWGLRLRRLVVAFGLVGVVVGSVVWVGSRSEAVVVPAAYEGAEWYPEYFEDINWVWSTSVAFDPLSPLRVRDVRTRHVNVVDGRRVTWAPPACEGCRRLRVWVYGGSTTFGLGQRDEHTIPSELARVAWEQGVVLDVDNRGVPGDAHWEEAQRFAWDLANEAPPDLVVFYDGVNEIRSLEFVTDGPARPVSFVKENFWRQYLGLTGESGAALAESLVGRRPGGTPPGGSIVPVPAAPELDATGWGELAVARFERSRATSSVLADGYGVPVVYLWQPALEHRPAPVEGEPALPGRVFAVDRARAARAALSGEVVDLSRALDSVDRPVFYDSNHTNELGARVVAEQMYRAVAPRLTQLAGAPAAADTGGP